MGTIRSKCACDGFFPSRLPHPCRRGLHPRFHKEATLMKTGLAYRSGSFYRLLMRLLYRGEYELKYQAVADLIPAGASVVDVCAGDCKLAEKLIGKQTSYLALEINPAFVARAVASG